MRRPHVLNAEEGGSLVPVEHPDDAALPGDVLLHHSLPRARAGQVRCHLDLNNISSVTTK